MTTAELLTALQAALVADTALNAWCVTQFGAAPTIWIGLDEQNPPVESDYPLVALVGVDQGRGGARGEIQWQVHIGVGVVNPALLSPEGATTRTYSGMLQAETLRELAENALYRMRPAESAINIDSSGEASSVSYHPLYVSYTTVLVSSLKSNRRGLP